MQAAGVLGAGPGVFDQFECQGGYLAGPGRILPLGAPEGPGLTGVEEGEPDGDGDREADADLGCEPAQVT